MTSHECDKDVGFRHIEIWRERQIKQQFMIYLGLPSSPSLKTLFTKIVVIWEEIIRMKIQIYMNMK